MNALVTKVSPRALIAAGVALFVLLIVMQAKMLSQKKAFNPQSIVEYSMGVRDNTQSLLIKALYARVAYADYMFTGDKSLLAFYYTAAGLPLPAGVPPLKDVTDSRTIYDIFKSIHVDSDNDPMPERQRHDYFESLIRREFEFIGNGLQKQQGSPGNTAETRQRHEADDGLMQEIRTISTAIIDNEKNELNAHIVDNQDAARKLDYSIVATTLTSNGIFLLATILIAMIFYRMRGTEHNLRMREAYFRAAIEGTIDAFFIFRALRDEKGKVQNLELADLNPAAERMLSARPEELVGRMVSAILPLSASQVDAKEACLGVLHTGVPQETEYVAVSGPAAGRSFQQQIIPLPDGVAITCRDITERRKIERMKNEFVSTVSHELRTPLTSIRGSLGLITGGVAGQISDQAKSLLTIAYNNCERLVRLINDILDIEKIESGGMVFQIRAVPLLPLVRQVMAANEAFADKYKVKVVLDSGRHCIGDDNVMAMADGDRLAQVLTNLLSNACKFSHSGGEVIVRCCVAGDHVRVDVEDHGSGIPKEFQSRIFEKFAQADSSDTRQKGGTGLGLSIVKAIVEEMKGEIGFDSKEGRGTTFFFTLPLVPTEQVSPIISGERGVLVQQRILVCEDDPDIAQLLTLILERAGFFVDVAPNASAALALLKEQSYLAMTLDLALPDKDGITLIKELRANHEFADLPVIVVSVKAEEGRQEIGGDAFGIVDWLSKPIDMDKLVHIVEHLSETYQKPRILHVEDDRDIVEILRLSLQDISDFVPAMTLYEARQHLDRGHFDLVILDVNLPDGQGTDLLSLMVNEDGTAIPVVLFTAIEVPHEIGMRVAASLTKSRTSEQKLLETIQKIIADGRAEHRGYI